MSIRLVCEYWNSQTCWASKLVSQILRVKKCRSLAFSGSRSCAAEAQTQLQQFLKGLCWVSVCWVHCVPCLWCFLVSILCPIAPLIFGTICCGIFHIYNVHGVSGDGIIWVHGKCALEIKSVISWIDPGTLGTLVRPSTAPGLGVCEWNPEGLDDKSVPCIREHIHGSRESPRCGVPNLGYRILMKY